MPTLINLQCNLKYIMQTLVYFMAAHLDITKLNIISEDFAILCYMFRSS